MVYRIYNCGDVLDELKKVYYQWCKSESLNYTGPSELHHSITATSFGPKEHLSENGLAYHEERDRDFIDVLLLVAFQFGFHNGVLTEQETTNFYKKLLDISHGTYKNET